jgi:hypothetical protein
VGFRRFLVVLHSFKKNTDCDYTCNYKCQLDMSSWKHADACAAPSLHTDYSRHLETVLNPTSRDPFPSSIGRYTENLPLHLHTMSRLLKDSPLLMQQFSFWHMWKAERPVNLPHKVSEIRLKGVLFCFINLCTMSTFQQHLSAVLKITMN